MAFRTRAPIDPNQHKGLVVQNDDGLGGLLIPSGRSLTNSVPLDVSIVDSSGSQITGSGLITKAYDYVGFSNADGNGNYQTVVYKTNGAAGTTVNTLAITYDGSSNVTSITKT